MQKSWEGTERGHTADMREVLGSMRTQTQRTRARGLLLGDQWVQGCGIPKASPDLPVDPRGCRTVACMCVRRGVPCLYLLAPDQSSRVRTHTHTHTHTHCQVSPWVCVTDSQLACQIRRKPRKLPPQGQRSGQGTESWPGPHCPAMVRQAGSLTV